MIFAGFNRDRQEEDRENSFFNRDGQDRQDKQNKTDPLKRHLVYPC